MESLENINILTKSLLLPALSEDLDNVPIERENFKYYHEYLDTHLSILYDFVQQDNFQYTEEMQSSLIVLLCEITSPNTIFQLNRSDLVHNAERILKTFTNLEKVVDDMIYTYYEDKLHKDKWKRQLGAVHGFVKYLEFRFSTVCNLEQRMSQKFIMFCLSVSLNIRSCYETHYKILSTLIFITVLQKGSKEYITSMNIHGVIYDAVFKNIYTLDSICFVVKQWNCLIKCLDFYDSFDSFSWNYLDEMMEVLLRTISLSPDSATTMCLLKFVNRLVIYFTFEHKEFEEFFGKDLSLEENINNCRSLACINTSYTCYRWAKGILQMFTVESYKLMQTAEIAKQMLQEIHKIYILAILPIRLTIVEPHLIIFLEKYIPVLMETLKVHKYQEYIKAIQSLLETFYFHLQSLESCPKLSKFKQNINALLKTKIFQKYGSI